MPLLLGRYRPLVKLGQGRRGDVCLAADGDRLVAIKRLRDADHPQHRAMFLNEARVAGQLDHPNIVRTQEVRCEGSDHLVVMEYLEGMTLARLRRAAAPAGGVPWPIEIEIVRGVLAGLHHAHELRAPDGRPLQLVHRDLTGENVLCTRAGEAKLLGFGVPRTIGPPADSQTGMASATLDGVPPEQIRGQRVDRRADVYAAGALLWEGLSRRPLWGELGHAVIATRLVQGDLPSLREQGPDVPEELRRICERALHPHAEGRFESALAMQAALMDCARRLGLLCTRARVAELSQPLHGPEREAIERLLSRGGARPGPAGPSPEGRADLAARLLDATTLSGAAAAGERRRGRAAPKWVLAAALLAGAALLVWPRGRPGEAPAPRATAGAPAPHPDAGREAGQ
jgi:serine/threonine-protein kinase